MVFFFKQKHGFAKMNRGSQWVLHREDCQTDKKHCDKTDVRFNCKKKITKKKTPHNGIRDLMRIGL